MDNKETIKYFDLVVSHIDKPHQFWVYNILHDHILKGDPEFDDKVYEIENPVTDFGVSHGYFDRQILTNGNQLGSLTPLGRKLKDFGKGHEAFEKHLEEKNRPQVNIENFIGRDNYGIQSSDSDFKKPIIKNTNAAKSKKAVTKSNNESWYTNSWLIGLALVVIAALFNTTRIMNALNHCMDGF